MPKFLAATKMITFIRELDKPIGTIIHYETNRKYFKKTLRHGDHFYIRVQGNNHVYQFCKVSNVSIRRLATPKFVVELEVINKCNISPNEILSSFQVKAGAEFGRLRESND